MLVEVDGGQEEAFTYFLVRWIKKVIMIRINKTLFSNTRISWEKRMISMVLIMRIMRIISKNNFQILQSLIGQAGWRGPTTKRCLPQCDRQGRQGERASKGCHYTLSSIIELSWLWTLAVQKCYLPLHWLGVYRKARVHWAQRIPRGGKKVTKIEEPLNF